MILHACSGMLEFPEQVLERSMPVGRGTKGPLGHPLVQTWTDNDYLNLRALLRALFDIISSSGRSPEELFLRSGNSPASVCPSNCPSVNISCCRISSKTIGQIFFKTWSECSPQCLVVQVPKRIPSAIFVFFFCYRISSETT